MDKNKIIILALIAVIVFLLVGLAFTVMPNMIKKDTKLTFENNGAMAKGNSIEIKLTDADGSAIAGQAVNVEVTNKDNLKDYHSVKTNDEGVGTLNLDKDAGEYDVTISYDGNDKYNVCNATKKIAIEEKVAEAEVTGSSQSSSSGSSGADNLPPSNDPYPETNRYYIDENHIKQEYADGYMRTVDVRTGEVHSLGFR